MGLKFSKFVQSPCLNNRIGIGHLRSSKSPGFFLLLDIYLVRWGVLSWVSLLRSSTSHWWSGSLPEFCGFLGVLAPPLVLHQCVLVVLILCLGLADEFDLLDLNVPPKSFRVVDRNSYNFCDLTLRFIMIPWSFFILWINILPLEFRSFRTRIFALFCMTFSTFLVFLLQWRLNGMVYL